MTPAPRTWLPKGAVDPERLTRACAAVLTRWGDAWFVSGTPPLTFQEAAGRVGAGAGGTIYDSAGVRLHLDTRSRELLYAAIVGPVPDGAELNEEDRSVLDGCVEAAFRDLGERLVAFAENPASGGDLRSFDLCMAGRVLVSLSANDAFIGAASRGARGAAEDKSDLVPLRAALGSCHVTLAADLGTADIEIRELRALVKGDVIVLDAGLGDGVRVRLAASDELVALGALEEVSGRNAVRIAG